MHPVSNRWGKLRIDGELIAADAPDFKRIRSLMGQLVVVRAMDCLHNGSIEYTAISPLFDELEEGEPIPEYLIEGQISNACPSCGSTEIEETVNDHNIFNCNNCKFHFTRELLSQNCGEFKAFRRRDSGST